MDSAVEFDSETKRNIDLWLNGQYDDATKAAIRKMVDEDPKEALDSFYSNLTFGTGGMRGIMGVGTNRMNVYTVRAATQGLANYICHQPKSTNVPAVFIGYDSRNNSRLFAEEAAKVLAGNGILVHLCPEIRPTPFVSFGVRFKKCISGIMITASHNPPEYNGYKVYWADGGQVVPPHDVGITDEALKITDPTMVKMAASLSDPLIQQVESRVDEEYLKQVAALQHYLKENDQKGSQLKIVYTSLHGTGITLVPKALKSWGFTNVSFVAPQIIPDGNFPTAKFPNPEEKAALKLGIDLMQESKSDILIATDPDADRVGVAIMHENNPITLTGNQMAAICLEHICEALSSQKRLPENAAFVKSIATTELFQAICDAYKRPCYNVLIGFKYIAEKIHEWELSPGSHQYIFGGEESYGYLLGTYTRDKDAVSSSALICEVALQAKLQGKTLVDKLHDLYRKYGIYQEKLASINFGETKEGKEQMKLGMQRLRDEGLKEINNVPVLVLEDYELSLRTDFRANKREKVSLPISNVLVYWLADGSKVMIRPSGTEPKVKIYCGTVEKQFSSIEEGLKNSLARCDEVLAMLKGQLLS